MSYSWRIARLAGINVFMHWTFLLLLVFIGFLYAAYGSSPWSALVGIGFVLSIFTCVVLHELGHALMARQFGVPTKDITLLPIGGIARLQRMPEHPGQEFLVALAGPAVNVAIGGVLALGLWWYGVLHEAVPTALTEVAGTNFLANLMWVNIALVLFNLLPAFPMDGGRMLRALLASRLDYGKATSIAAGIGQSMAIVFGMLGLLSFNPILIFIALFVFLGAGAEAQQVQLRTLLKNIRVEQAMLTRFRSFSGDNSLGDVADELIAGSQQDFPIVDGDRLSGVLLRKKLVEGLRHDGRDHSTGEYASGECIVVDRHDMLSDVLPRLHEAKCSTAPVLDNDRLVGLLTLENVGEFMMIQTAMRGSSGNGHPHHDSNVAAHS